jgi:hypothetical protein
MNDLLYLDISISCILRYDMIAKIFGDAVKDQSILPVSGASDRESRSNMMQIGSTESFPYQNRPFSGSARTNGGGREGAL